MESSISDDKFKEIFTYLQNCSRKRNNESKFMENIKLMEEQIEELRNNNLNGLVDLQEKYKNDEMKINSKYIELSERHTKLQDEFESLNKKLKDFEAQSTFEKSALILQFENEMEFLKKSHQIQMQKLQQKIDETEAEHKTKVEKLEMERSIMVLRMDENETYFQKQIVDLNINIRQMQNSNASLRREINNIKWQQKHEQNVRKPFNCPMPEEKNECFERQEVMLRTETNSNYQQCNQANNSSEPRYSENMNDLNCSFNQLPDISTSNRRKYDSLSTAVPDSMVLESSPSAQRFTNVTVNQKSNENSSNYENQSFNQLPGNTTKYQPLPIINSNTNFHKINRPRINRPAIKSIAKKPICLNRKNKLPDLVKLRNNNNYNVNKDCSVVMEKDQQQSDNAAGTKNKSFSAGRKRQLFDPNNLDYLQHLEDVGD